MADRPRPTHRVRLILGLASVGLLAGCVRNSPGDPGDSTRTEPTTSPPSTASAAPVDSPTVTAGAVEAALRFVASTDTLLGHSSIGRRELLERIVAPEFVDRHEAALSEAVARIADTLGVPVERVLWVEAPLASRSEPLSDGSVLVDVWSVSVLAVPGKGLPEQVWRTVHVHLVVVDGVWLVTEAPADAGPTPAVNDLALPSGWDEFSTVAGWVPVIEGVSL